MLERQGSNREINATPAHYKYMYVKGRQKPFANIAPYLHFPSDSVSNRFFRFRVYLVATPIKPNSQETQSYLDPNIQSMQKTIEGVYPRLAVYLKGAGLILSNWSPEAWDVISNP